VSYFAGIRGTRSAAAPEGAAAKGVVVHMVISVGTVLLVVIIVLLVRYSRRR